MEESSMDELHGVRLRFLIETVALEAEHLLDTDGRAFVQPFTRKRAAGLRSD